MERVDPNQTNITHTDGDGGEDDGDDDLMIAQLRAQMEAMTTDGTTNGEPLPMETEEEEQAMAAAIAAAAADQEPFIPLLQAVEAQQTAPPQQQQQARRRIFSRPLEDPDPNGPRPWDEWTAAGPPADHPPPFDRPQRLFGRRGTVVAYIPALDALEKLHNVLLRDYEREGSGPFAYYPIPYKRPIETIMGHVEICAVLKRCTREDDDDDEDTSRKSNSESDDDEDREDDEDVFELTNQFVAVKVNYLTRVNNMRDRHAEDPMKEIAAMQLVGDDLPNVMGCSEVLFVSGRDVLAEAAKLKEAVEKAGGGGGGEAEASRKFSKRKFPASSREEDNDTINVVMRYCQHGDLFEALQQPWASSDRPGFSEPQARFWFRQIMEGIRDLHLKGVCHRDLSPENVMIDDNGCLIIDLGMCLRVPYTTTVADSAAERTVVPLEPSGGNNRPQSPPLRKLLIMPQGACGKLPYMSPEIYRNRRPFDGAAVDVWCAGTILFCMLTGNRSYHRPHATDPQFYWMTNGLNQLLADWNIPLSAEGHHLLRNMLQVDARLRLTIDEILAHPWFDLPHERVVIEQPML